MLRYFSWHGVFVLLAVFGLACAAAVAVKLPETLPRQRRARGHVGLVFVRYARLLSRREFMPFALTAAFTSGVLFAYITGSPFVFQQLHGLTPQQFALVFGGIAVGLYAGGQLNRWLLRRHEARTILRWSTLANAAAGATLLLIVLTGAGGLVPFTVTLWFCVASLGLIFPNAAAAALQPCGKEAGSASALLGMLQYAIGAAAGGLVGALGNGTAVPMAGVIAGSGLCGCVVLRVLGPGRERA
jgi:DHA1 family bicyclomycin/chloramphenicol resistance-like MFS transporter